MKKTLIALAVLGAAAGVAHAQTNVTIYGTIQPSYDFMTVKNSGVKNDITQMSSNASRIGFMGSEDLGGGLKAIFKVEQDVDVVDDTAFGGNARDTYVGLAGKFGTVTFGNINSTYKNITASYDPMEDTIGDYNSIMSNGINNQVSANNRNKQTANYVSPSWSGVQVMANYSLNTAKTDVSNEKSWGVGVVYNNGPLNLLAAYDKQNSRIDDPEGDATPVADAKFWKIGAAWNFGQGTTLRGIYEKAKSSDLGQNTKNFLVGAEHKIGAYTLMANYIDASGDGDTGAKAYNLGLNYALSKRTSVMGVYSYLKNDAGGYYENDAGYAGTAGAKISGFSVRLKHTF